MILGNVFDLTPRVKLAVAGEPGSVTIDFVVDTGFEGEIALPANLVGRVITRYVGPRKIQMADGRVAEGFEYVGSLAWDGKPRGVVILALPGGTPLIGVELLADHQVTIDMTDGGEVTIEPR